MGVNIWTILSPTIGFIGWVYMVVFLGKETIFVPIFAILSMIFGLVGYKMTMKKNQRFFGLGLFGFFVGMTLLMFSLYLICTVGLTSFLIGGSK